MKPLIRLLYGLSRLALLLLGVAFLSFWLITQDVGFAKSVAEYGTRYVPLLLLPVAGAMVVILILRWLLKSPDEKVGFGDFFAFLIAAGCQLGVILLYRAQGAELAGDFAMNIPKVEKIVELAEPAGMLGIAGLQFAAFFFYWVADPDPAQDG